MSTTIIAISKRRYDRITGLLLETLELLAGYEDVDDGSDGVPQANPPMRLCQDIRAALDIERIPHD